MHYRRLSSHDAKSIGDLEKRIYRNHTERISGSDDFFEDIEEAEIEEKERHLPSNFSYGAFDDEGRIVGYLVGFREDSERSDNEEVAYVSDWAVDPDYKNTAVPGILMLKFAEEIKALGLPIEAELRANTSYQLIKSHPEILSKMGYEVTEEHLEEDYNGGEDFVMVRLDPLTKDVKARINTLIEDDQLPDLRSEIVEGSTPAVDMEMESGAENESSAYSKPLQQKYRETRRFMKASKKTRVNTPRTSSYRRSPQQSKIPNDPSISEYHAEVLDSYDQILGSPEVSAEYLRVVGELFLARQLPTRIQPSGDDNRLTFRDLLSDVSFSQSTAVEIHKTFDAYLNSLFKKKYSDLEIRNVLAGLQCFLSAFSLMHHLEAKDLSALALRENVRFYDYFDGREILHDLLDFFATLDDLDLASFKRKVASLIELLEVTEDPKGVVDSFDLSVRSYASKAIVDDYFGRHSLDEYEKLFPTHSLFQLAQYIQSFGSNHFKDYTFETFVQLMNLCKNQEQVFVVVNSAHALEDFIHYPWLVQTYASQRDIPLFPVNGNYSEQADWILEHAFYKPQDWLKSPFAKLVLRRLNKRLDESLHDATYWFVSFDVPKDADHEDYFDTDSEKELISLLLSDVPLQIKKVTTRDAKIDEYISDSDTRILCKLASRWRKEESPGDFMDFLEDHLIHTDIGEYSADGLREKAKQLLEDSGRSFSGVGDGSSILAQCYARLKVCGARRKKYRSEAQKWISRHWQSPSYLLTQAWNARPLALANGVPDNPGAIIQWSEKMGVISAFRALEAKGKLPDNLDLSDIDVFSDWIDDLVRHYDGHTIIRFISWIKDNLNKDQNIAALQQELSDGKYAEILPKYSSRGATIGPDTGCCMSLGGASDDCIRAGYSNPNCGFFELRNHNRNIIAQSFIWVNEQHSPDTLVLDNIEVNEGRDASKVLASYREFFKKYLLHRKSEDPEFRIRKVYVGTGYMSLDLSELSFVEPIPQKYSSYTDATQQKLLLEIPISEFESAASASELSLNAR